MNDTSWPVSDGCVKYLHEQSNNPTFHLIVDSNDKDVGLRKCQKTSGYETPCARVRGAVPSYENHAWKCILDTSTSLPLLDARSADEPRPRCTTNGNTRSG